MDTSIQNPTSIDTEILTLLERRREDENIFTYIFKPKNPVNFKAGQYAHVRSLALPEGTKRVRELSFASSPQDHDIWFGVDARSGSDYQKSLKALTPGDVIELFKIRGHMTWPPPTSNVVMIAGGVGITPFRSMLLDAQQRNLSVKTTLVQVSSGVFLYSDHLQNLCNQYIATNRSELLKTLREIAHEHSDAHYYIAGSEGFVKSVADKLAKNGITQIESDEFKGLID